MNTFLSAAKAAWVAIWKLILPSFRLYLTPEILSFPQVFMKPHPKTSSGGLFYLCIRTPPTLNLNSWPEFFLYPGSVGNRSLHLRRITGKGRSTRTFLPCFYPPSTSAPSLLSPSNHPFAYCSTWFRIHSHEHSGQPAAWLDIILISFLVYLWRSQPYKSP